MIQRTLPLNCPAHKEIGVPSTQSGERNRPFIQVVRSMLMQWVLWRGAAIRGREGTSSGARKRGSAHALPRFSRVDAQRSLHTSLRVGRSRTTVHTTATVVTLMLVIVLSRHCTLCRFLTGLGVTRIPLRCVSHLGTLFRTAFTRSAVALSVGHFRS